jgi:hypothetical protein
MFSTDIIYNLSISCFFFFCKDTNGSGLWQFPRGYSPSDLQDGEGEASAKVRGEVVRLWKEQEGCWL